MPPKSLVNILGTPRILKSLNNWLHTPQNHHHLIKTFKIIEKIHKTTSKQFPCHQEKLCQCNKHLYCIFNPIVKQQDYRRISRAKLFKNYSKDKVKMVINFIMMTVLMAFCFHNFQVNPSIKNCILNKQKSD